MAKTISNLLVGVGFSLDKRSTNKVSSGIDSVKNKALQVTGILAGGFGLKALTSDFAGAKDELGKFAQVFGSTPNDINAFGNAMRQEGGTLQGFMSQLRNFEKFRAGLQRGDIGFLSEAAIAGINTAPLINATDAVDGFLTLADQFQRLSPQQRLNAADALGLDEAAIRLLSKGRKEVQAIIDQQKRIRPITAEQTFLADEFNDSTQDLFSNIGAFADQISDKLLPIINNVVKGMNRWAEANKNFGESLGGFLDPLNEITEDRGAEVAATLGLLGGGAAVGVGGAIAAKGGAALGIGALSTTGILSGLLGRFLLAAGLLSGGLLAAEAVIKKEDPNADLNDAAAVILRLLGIDDGQDKVKQNIQLKQSQIRETSRLRPPEKVEINLNLDGKVLDKRTINLLGEEAGKAIEDISSSEGG